VYWVSGQMEVWILDVFSRSVIRKLPLNFFSLELQLVEIKDIQEIEEL
jgi:hypothetical protein